MRLITRNLFPRRPPTAKCDGPSVLKASAGCASSAKAVSPLTTSLYASSPSKPPSSTTTPTSSTTQPSSTSKTPSSGLSSGRSASLTCLVLPSASNTSSHRHLPPGRSSGATVGPSSSSAKNSNYEGSHESFQCSTDSSSPSASLSSSSSSVENLMISRRKILSKSREALTTSTETEDSEETPNGRGQRGAREAPEPDRWTDLRQLLADHIEEIVSKWEQIDDEIWAKVICMERDRRVGKAYARVPVLAVGAIGEPGFDGERIGVHGFANPKRDRATESVRRSIGAGLTVAMDESGNLHVRRAERKAEVRILKLDAEGAGNSKGRALEVNKTTLLFDMRHFQGQLFAELKQVRQGSSRDATVRRALEARCFSFLGFGPASGSNLLETPVWVVVVNLVALEMLLKSLPSALPDESFYSMPMPSQRQTVFGSSRAGPSSLPPKLPPRDLHNAKPPLTLPEPDYEDESLAGRSVDDMAELIFRHQSRTKEKEAIPAVGTEEDPYFCGLTAHVPQFSPQQLPVQHSATGTTSSRSQPPIVRKKFWSSTGNFKFFGGGGGGSGNSSSKSSKPPEAKERFNKSATLDYRLPSGPPPYSGPYGNYSQFNAQQHRPQQYTQTQYHHPQGQYHPQQGQQHPSFSLERRRLVSDNNVIYGVANPSLWRKHWPLASHQPHLQQQALLLAASHRSLSSPSLKHAMHQRTRNSSRDQNNNRFR